MKWHQDYTVKKTQKQKQKQKQKHRNRNKNTKTETKQQPPKKTEQQREFPTYEMMETCSLG